MQDMEIKMSEDNDNDYGLEPYQPNDDYSYDEDCCEDRCDECSDEEDTGMTTQEMYEEFGGNGTERTYLGDGMWIEPDGNISE